MAQPAAVPKVNWAPLIIVLVAILIMALGSMVRSNQAQLTQEQLDAQQIEDIRQAEEFHCQMFGMPSEEGQAAGYVCP